MKKTVINLAKTLLFFDVLVIIIAIIPDIKFKNQLFINIWHETVPILPIVLFTAFFTRKFEKGKIKVHIFGKHTFKNIILGLFIGAFLLGSVLGIMAVMKLVTISGHQTIELFFLWFIPILSNCIATELLVHGYLYQLYKRDFGQIVSMIITTLLYLSLNLQIFKQSHICAVNTVLFSILLVLLLAYTNKLIVPIIVRFIWFAVGNLVLGGVHFADAYPVLLNTAFVEKKSYSGAAVLMDGSILTTGILILLIVLFSLLYHKKAARRKQVQQSKTF